MGREACEGLGQALGLRCTAGLCDHLLSGSTVHSVLCEVWPAERA